MSASRFWVAVVLVPMSARVLACPGCKEALKGDGFWSSGFNWSIVFMLAVVFSMIGFVAYKVFKIIQREAVKSAGDPETVHATSGYWTKVTLPICGVVLAVLMALGSVSAQPKTAPASEGNGYTAEVVASAEISKGDGDVLLTFKAETCSICVQMKPAMSHIEADYVGKVTMIYVNARTSQELVQRFKVDNLPCSVYIQGGKETSRREGLSSEDELRAWIDARLK